LIGWAAFGKEVSINLKASMKIKRKIKDEYILPVITYGNDKMGIEQSYDGETCGCTAKNGTPNTRYYTLRDRKRKTWIRKETGVSDIVNAIRIAKDRLADLIAWVSDNRWTIRTTKWTSRDWTRERVVQKHDGEMKSRKSLELHG